MTFKVSADSVRRLRALKLGLGNGKNNLIDLIDSNGGLHTNSITSPYLSLAARNAISPFAGLNKAQLRERKLVRIKAMRSEYFIVPTFRLPMMLSAFKARYRAIKEFYGYWKVNLEDTPKDRQRLLNVLSNSAHTLKELRTIFPDLAEKLLIGKKSERSNMLNFLVNLLQMEGVVISEKVMEGNKIKNFFRFYTISNVFPELKALSDQDESLKKLVTWYFENHSPADIDDLAWWTGMNKITVKKAYAAQDLVEVEVGTNFRKLYTLPSVIEQLKNVDDKPLTGVWLLPFEDPFLKAHKDRSLQLSGVPDAAVFRNGQARPSICVDGRVVGLWRFIEHGDEFQIGVEIFDKDAVDLEQLRIIKESTIKFAMNHFPRNIDNAAKGIMTGCEPYA